MWKNIGTLDKKVCLTSFPILVKYNLKHRFIIKLTIVKKVLRYVSQNGKLMTLEERQEDYEDKTTKLIRFITWAGARIKTKINNTGFFCFTILKSHFFHENQYEVIYNEVIKWFDLSIKQCIEFNVT